MRQLPKIHPDPKVNWLDPVDVDDSQHWLLSNLEGYVADQLDPDRQYFGEFFAYLSELPPRRLTPTNRQMVLDHLNRIKDVFTQCYKDYIDQTGNSVVMTFDTVEAIRGMYLLRTLTRWMKALPSTLFILAGRSQPGIREVGPHQGRAQRSSPTYDRHRITLGQFSAADCREYLTPISQEADLSEEEWTKLSVSPKDIRSGWHSRLTISPSGPAGGGACATQEDRGGSALPWCATPAGQERADSFKRRLMAPYQDADFWHEAIKRLAVIRESVSQPIWQQLMADSR